MSIIYFTTKGVSDHSFTSDNLLRLLQLLYRKKALVMHPRRTPLRALPTNPRRVHGLSANNVTQPSDTLLFHIVHNQYDRRYPLRHYYHDEDGTEITTIASNLADTSNDGGIPLLLINDPEYKGPEIHVPTHNFLGPGTNVVKRVSSLDMPINHSDAVALVHDIEYYGLPEHIADLNAIQNAKGSMKYIMKAAFKTKDLFGGMQPERLSLIHI